MTRLQKKLAERITEQDANPFTLSRVERFAVDGFKFYEEIEPDTGASAGNCLAVPRSFNPTRDDMTEGYAPVCSNPNDGVVWCKVASAYILEETVYVSSERAKELHPRLIERMVSDFVQELAG